MPTASLLPSSETVQRANDVLTWEQYLKEPHVEGRYDIIDGVRVFPNKEDGAAGADWNHQQIVLNLAELFRVYERITQRGKTQIAPFDVVITKVPRLHTRQPDLFFISREQLAKNSDPIQLAPLDTAPELVVEVLSFSETPRTIGDKVEDFRRIGVKECWLVSPQAETVEILRLSDQGVETAAVYTLSQTLTSLTFPDLQIALSKIFAY